MGRLKDDGAPSVALRTALWVLVLLFLANILNTGDRGLLGMVTEQVRGELSLSDTQMSLANGLFFTVFNLVGGLFLSRMIDRGNRTRILAFGIAGWSIATAATGLATDFTTLALARIGVGIGEATAFPAAMSLIPDLFRAQARGRAVAVFQSSAFIGIVGGAIAAGVLAAAIGWRTMFFWAGGVGVVLALVMLATATEPARAKDARPAAPAGTFADLSQGLLRLWYTPGLARLVAGYGIAGMLTSVLAAWGPAFLQRSHGVPLAQVGVAIGPAVGIGGVTGTIASGMLASRLARKRGNELHGLLVPVIAMPIALPFYAIFCFAPSLSLTVAAAAIMNFLLSSGSSPCFAAVLGLSPPSMRGVSSTIMLAASGVVGGAIAPLLVGAVSDALMPALGKGSLRYALATMLITPLLGAAVLWLAYRRSRLTQAIDSLPAGRPPLKPNET
jgi:MFS family permease